MELVELVNKHNLSIYNQDFQKIGIIECRNKYTICIQDDCFSYMLRVSVKFMLLCHGICIKTIDRFLHI